MRTTLAAFVGFLIGVLAATSASADDPRPLTVARRAPVAAADHGTPSIAGRAGAVAKSERPADASSEASQTETAVFAGGCFWCTELAFEQLRGVENVESGYCGGTRHTATYDRVHRGVTAHAEAIRITYDPSKISYEQLLEVFFDAHDPTQFKRQDEDQGRQYRSAIFFADSAQKKTSEAKIAELQRKHLFARHIVTRVEPLVTFFPAEDFHQDFARRNLLLPYVQEHAIPKACNVRIKHPELIDPTK